MLQDFRVKCWNRHARNAHRRSFPPPLDAYIHIYIHISAQPVKKPSNQIRAIFLPILSIRFRTFYSCAAGVLHDHHYLLQASRNVQHRIDGWPGMGAALEEHPVQQVQGLSSSKQKRALSQVGTTFGKVRGGKRRWKRQKQAFLRSTVRLLQKLTSVFPYHSILFYLKIPGFSTKFNQFRFLCFLYIYIVLDSLENALERY